MPEMQMPETNKYRSVNATLGKQPHFGPFPADQLMPWSVILGISYFLGYSLLRLNWVWVVALALTGVSTWWTLTANGAWQILSKFIAVPNWTRGYSTYKSLDNRNSLIGNRQSR